MVKQYEVWRVNSKNHSILQLIWYTMSCIMFIHIYSFKLLEVIGSVNFLWPLMSVRCLVSLMVYRSTRYFRVNFYTSHNSFEIKTTSYINPALFSLSIYLSIYLLVPMLRLIALAFFNLLNPLMTTSWLDIYFTFTFGKPGIFSLKYNKKTYTIHTYAHTQKYTQRTQSHSKQT